MLDKLSLIESYFDNAPVAIMLFKDDTLLASNHLADELQQTLNLDPTYLLDMAKTVLHNHQSEMVDCAACAPCQQQTELAIPVLTNKVSPESSCCYMLYKVLDAEQGLVSLTLKNQNSITKVINQATQEHSDQITIDAEQKERQRISADLHDCISQNIYSSVMGVKRLTNEQLTPQETNDLSGSIIDQLNNTLTEIKDMALTIRPAVLDNFGLFCALRTLAKRLESSTGIKITVAGNAQPEKLTTIMQNALYTVAQESINNVLKHAHATEIVLLLVEHANFITLEIIDDGTGFDVKEHQQFNGHSLGLQNMNDRIKSLNGIFKIESDPTIGTTITVKFPVTLSTKDDSSCITS